ncbi:MAG: hypothetical protein INQ03_16210 [Candidatus Heimdallarchaeota archaeon]|nr:hypothetical protein [Candidatus Heimdallarchaeota archaeon]
MEIKPEFITIMTQDGIPLVTQMISPNLNIPEPALISGFLSALQSFSSEVLSNNNSNYMEIKVKNQHLIIYKRGVFNIGGMVNKTGNELKRILNYIADEVEMVYQPSFKPLNREIIEYFNELVISSFSTYIIERTWVPRFTTNNTNTINWAHLINGQSNIQQIIRQGSIDSNEVYRETFRLWILGEIDFRINLHEYDYVQYNHNTQPYLLSDENFCENADNRKPCFTTREITCKTILRSIKGTIDVGSLINLHEEAIELINCMHQYKMFELLNDQVKQLFLIKSIVQKLLDVVVENQGFNFVTKLIHELREDYSSIDTEITVEKNWITIDKDISNYLQMDRFLVDSILDKWTTYIVDVIKKVTPKKRKMVVDDLVINAQIEITEFYQFIKTGNTHDFLFNIENLSLGNFT